MNATLLHRCYNRTGEAATWMPGLECLLWVDIDNGILYQYTPDEGTVKEHTFSGNDNFRYSVEGARG